MPSFADLVFAESRARTAGFRNGYRCGYRNAAWESYADNIAWSEGCGRRCGRCDGKYRQRFRDRGDFASALSTFMIVCVDCGNTRCPRAAYHDNDCTGSNAAGQPGSNYPARDEAPPPLMSRSVARRLAIRETGRLPL